MFDYKEQLEYGVERYRDMLVEAERLRPLVDEGWRVSTVLEAVRHAFERLGCRRVEFKTDARNLRSQRALERIGATREGVLRKHMIVQDDYSRDSVYFSVIDDDWPDVAERLQVLLRRQ